MPRVKPLGSAAKAADAEVKRIMRMQSIINAAAAANGYRTARQLCAAMGANYNTMTTRIRNGAFTVKQFGELADFLGLDDQTRAACCGSPTKCRYEIGWRENA